MPYVPANEALNRRSVKIDDLVRDHDQQAWRQPLVATNNVRDVLLLTPPATNLPRTSTLAPTRYFTCFVG